MWTSSHFDYGKYSKIAVAAIALLASHGSEGVQNDTSTRDSRQSPDDLALAARRGNVRQFASAVAAARIPVGLVIAADERRSPDLWNPAPDSSRAVADLEGILTTFADNHQRYMARRVDEVVRIEPKTSSACAHLLERRIGPLDTSGRIVDAMHQAIRAADGDRKPVAPAGVVGSSSEPLALDLYDTPVSVRLDDARLGEALDALIKVAPGVGWAIEEKAGPAIGHGGGKDSGRPTYCAVKLFTGDSWLHTSWSVPARPH